jgi:hypothetical protein
MKKFLHVKTKPEKNKNENDLRISMRCLSFRIGFNWLAGWLHIRVDDSLPLAGGGHARPDIWHKEQDTFNATFHGRDSVIADLGHTVPNHTDKTIIIH